MRAAVLTAAAMALLAHAPGGPARQQPQPRPVFQAGTDTVVLDIAVRHGDEPVKGLATGDFEVLDNGVPQAIDHMTAETFPMDLTLLIDESGYGQDVIDQIKSAAAAAATLLGDEDRVRVLAFNAKIQQLFEGPPDGVADAIAPIEAAGRTSVYDAIVASLMRKRAADRRALVVTFTVGIDTSSTISPEMLKDVTRRADVILDVFLSYRPENPLAGRFNTENGQYDDHIREAAEATGGFLEEMLGDDHVTKKLRSALLDFKSRYLLSYTVSGTARPGWHDINVRIRKHPDYKVLVRKGYDGGK